METTTPEIEPRALIAAVEDSRLRQRIAKFGAVGAFAMCYVANSLGKYNPSLETVLYAVAPFVAIGAAIPFWRIRCPKCGGRFHGLRSLFHSLDDPAPCASCGFDLGSHVPRYGRPRFDR